MGGAGHRHLLLIQALMAWRLSFRIRWAITRSSSSGKTQFTVVKAPLSHVTPAKTHNTLEGNGTRTPSAGDVHGCQTPSPR